MKHSLSRVLVQVLRTEPEDTFDLCDQMRAKEDANLVCPIGMPGVGGYHCFCCPLNERAIWIEGISHHEAD